MITFIAVLIILLCIVLGFFILVLNPKGGGLSGTFGSVGSQMMGVKQSTDVMEKGSWTVMGLIAVLCIASVMFLQKPQQDTNINNFPQQQAPQQQQQ